MWARAGEIGTADRLAIPLRVLIAPMYVVWNLWTIAQVALLGPVGLPQPIASMVSAIGLAAGLAPYVLLDYILNLWRRRASTGTEKSQG
jgi:hypothetical protein